MPLFLLGETVRVLGIDTMSGIERRVFTDRLKTFGSNMSTRLFLSMRLIECLSRAVGLVRPQALSHSLIFEVILECGD